MKNNLKNNGPLASEITLSGEFWNLSNNFLNVGHSYILQEKIFGFQFKHVLDKMFRLN